MMNTSHPAPLFISKKRRIILLPIGSCEQHGPHLPVDTDLRIAQLLAEKVACSMKSHDPLLLPAIPFSCSWEHKGLGTIALNTATLAAVVHDIARSLHTWNVPTLLILVNWHGGNDILAPLAVEISATEDIPTAVIPAVSQVGKAWDESGITDAKEIHAGAVETSIVRAYWPDAITGDISDKDHCEPVITPAKAQAVMQSVGIKAVSPSGIWGAPEAANADKGRELIEKLVKRMVEQTGRILEIVNTTAKKASR
jgi:creatinine amidohydrolase/Fe(II)-dependent formamide hydrolase-like protein